MKLSFIPVLLLGITQAAASLGGPVRAMLGADRDCFQKGFKRTQAPLLSGERGRINNRETNLVFVFDDKPGESTKFVILNTAAVAHQRVWIS